MARRPLLTDEERRLLFGVPGDPDALARHYTFTRSDQDLVAGRRGDTNRLGFAVQLALLSHPGMGLAQMEEPVEALVEWLAAQLGRAHGPSWSAAGRRNRRRRWAEYPAAPPTTRQGRRGLLHLRQAYAGMAQQGQLHGKPRRLAAPRRPSTRS